MGDGVLLLNLGGPRGPDELVPFLRALFNDVLPLPSPVRGWVASRIATSRAPKVLPNYEAIGWSPTVPTTERQLEAVAQRFPDVRFAVGMACSPPTVAEGVDRLLDQGVTRLVALALYPHWSRTTTGAAYDAVATALAARGKAALPVHYVPAFGNHPAWIDAVADAIRDAAGRVPGEGPVHLVFSPHGLPSREIRAQDPYAEQVRENARRVVEALRWTDPWWVGWQSRLGPVRWLGPSTLERLDAIAAAGGRRVVVVPLSFVGEHIETLFELDVEVADHARHHGLAWARAAAPGLHPRFVDLLADLIRDARAAFDAYKCVRCLVPQDEAHQRRGACPDCRFVPPAYLRSPGAFTG